MVEILKILKGIKVEKGDSNNSLSDNSANSSENSQDSDSENNDEKSVQNYINVENIELSNHTDRIDNKDYLHQIKEEIYLSDTHNENISNNLNKLNSMQDNLKIYIDNDIDIFETEFEKINNESIDFEEQFKNSVKKIVPNNKIDLKNDNIKDEEIKKSDYYINLLRSF